MHLQLKNMSNSNRMSTANSSSERQPNNNNNGHNVRAFAPSVPNTSIPLNSMSLYNSDEQQQHKQHLNYPPISDDDDDILSDHLAYDQGHLLNQFDDIHCLETAATFVSSTSSSNFGFNDVDDNQQLTDQDDDTDDDNFQHQLTFKSNKTFPMDYLHRQNSSSTPSPSNTPPPPPLSTRSSIATRLGIPLFNNHNTDHQQNQYIDHQDDNHNQVILQQDLDGNNHPPPPPSPQTPPELYHVDDEHPEQSHHFTDRHLSSFGVVHEDNILDHHHHALDHNKHRSSFQSFKSMPTERILSKFEDDDDHHFHNDKLESIIPRPLMHDSIQQSEKHIVVMVDDEISTISTSAPPPYHQFEPSTSSTTMVPSPLKHQASSSFGYIDDSMTNINDGPQSSSNSSILNASGCIIDRTSNQTLNRQQSRSTTDLNSYHLDTTNVSNMDLPPNFDQLFGAAQTSTNHHPNLIETDGGSHIHVFSSMVGSSITPSPYARLIHFKQHHQHLNVPPPSPSSSYFRRRRSLPPKPIVQSFLSNIQPLLKHQQQQEQQQMQNNVGSSSPSGLLSLKEKRIGHRRVNEEGQVTYKNIKSTQLMYSIQLGIGYSVGSMASKPERDLLIPDFMQIETVNFPKSGSQVTPAHHYTDFTFSTYTPFAFRYFRDLFRIQPDDFMLSITNEPLQELTNPGASGSMFFRTKDDQFILKTVQKNEAKFLLKLLPGYYMNLSQNPHTLLPKFFGLYCYECIGKNIRILVMNNLIPSNVTIHQKYDLKGSTYKRKANQDELKKQSPTFKDLDFLEYYYNDHENKTLMNHFSKVADSAITHPNHPVFPTDGGLLLEAHVYDELVGTLRRDCRVLQSFEIMDYSLLIGVHNYDKVLKENVGQPAPFDYDDDDQLPTGAIRAMNRKGERLLLFMGIIDILQSYRLVKKMEHAWKAILYDGNSISVTRPDFFANRFLDFMCKKVFGRLPTSPTIPTVTVGQAPSSSSASASSSLHDQHHHSHHRYNSMIIHNRRSALLTRRSSAVTNTRVRS